MYICFDPPNYLGWKLSLNTNQEWNWMINSYLALHRIFLYNTLNNIRTEFNKHKVAILRVSFIENRCALSGLGIEIYFL